MKKNFLFGFLLSLIGTQLVLGQCPIDVKGKTAIVYITNLPDNDKDRLYNPAKIFAENLMIALQDRRSFGVRLVNEDMAAIEFVTGTNMPTTTTDIGILLTFSQEGSKYITTFNVADIATGESCSFKKITMPTAIIDDRDEISVLDIIKKELVVNEILADANPAPPVPIPAPNPAPSSPSDIIALAETYFAQGKYNEAANEYKKLASEVVNFPKRLYPIYYLLKTTSLLDGSYVSSTMLDLFLSNSNSDEFVKIADNLEIRQSGYDIASSNDEYTAHLWQQAYQKGHAKATYKLGLAYLNGRGLAVNNAKGLDLLQDACNKNHTDACSFLVSHYIKQKNCSKAGEYINKVPTGKKSIRDEYNINCKGEAPIWKFSPISNKPFPSAIVGNLEATSCPTTGCNNAEPPKWVTYNGSIPANAIVGGKDGTTLYVCRCNYEGGKHVGKVFNGKCNIGWGGKEIAVGAFEILTGDKNCSYIWQPWTGGTIPAKAIIGGRESIANSSKSQYIIRASYNNSTHSGKLIQGSQKGFIGYGGVEQLVTPTHILVSCAAKTNNNDDFYSTNTRSGDCGEARPKWVPYSPSIINQAFRGNNPNALAICRCDYQNGKHAGKVVAGKCNIGFGGTEVVVSTNFEILIGGGCYLHWIKWDGRIPLNAVIAGVINDNGAYNTYIIKGSINGTEHPGKLMDGWNKGAIGFGGKEEFITPTHILVESF